MVDTGVSQHKEFTPLYIKGENLAATLNRLIDSQVTENRSRIKIIQEMAQAAGISESTVGQILRGEIICPPLRRLRGFAKVLNVSTQRLINAAKRDGCDYDGDKTFKNLIQTLDGLILALR